MVQYTTGRRFFEDIPYYYDANYVKILRRFLLFYNKLIHFEDRLNKKIDLSFL